MSGNRSHPLRTVPSLASLRGLLGGGANSNIQQQNESTFNRFKINPNFKSPIQSGKSFYFTLIYNLILKVSSTFSVPNHYYIKIKSWHYAYI